MKIGALGEFGLIQKLSSRFSDFFFGIGDDCAVIPRPDGSLLLVTTDMLVEGVHFLHNRIPPEDLGHKSLAVNLSDIAAMGGTPESIFLSLALPMDTEVEWVDRFFEGLGKLADIHQVRLLGGDTTRSPGPVVINITLLGSAASSKIKLRSTAKPGDVVCVTGFLGDSGAGLKALLENRLSSQRVQDLIRRHYRPTPQLDEGRWLAGFSGTHAMMDVSDGIDSDLRRIMEQSNCGMTIHLEQLPLSEELRLACQDFGWDPVEIAATSGEDYCLALTVDPAAWPKITQDFLEKFHKPLFRIGEITGPPRELRYMLFGKQTDLPRKGFDHFKSNQAYDQIKP